MGTRGSSGQQVSGWQTVEDGAGGMAARTVARWRERVPSGTNGWGTARTGARVGDGMRARAGAKGVRGSGTQTNEWVTNGANSQVGANGLGGVVGAVNGLNGVVLILFSFFVE